MAKTAKIVTYVGTSDIRSFGLGDAVGVELEFHRHQSQEVELKTADFLLGDPQFEGEFIEGEFVAPEPEVVTPDEPVVIDDAQVLIDGL